MTSPLVMMLDNGNQVRADENKELLAPNPGDATVFPQAPLF
jgi:hypothetical protein